MPSLTMTTTLNESESTSDVMARPGGHAPLSVKQDIKTAFVEHEISPPTSSESSLGRGYRRDKHPHHEVVYEEDADVPELAKTEEIKLLAKIDWRIMPVLCAMFTLAFLDKVNIANAATFGLSKDLKLKGTQYNNCASAMSYEILVSV